ncbi:hypothetical protein ACT3RX_18175 [Halomonas sp. AOP42-E1-40]
MMHDFQQSQPLVINIMLYRRRDGDLYRELMSVPNKYRAERLRNLANLCCLMREMGGIAVDSERLHSLAERHYSSIVSDDVEDSDGDETESSMPLKLTVNFYNYPELYRDLAAIPNGNVSSRVKALASAGALLNDISRLARHADNQGLSTRPSQNPQAHAIVKEPVDPGMASIKEEGEVEMGTQKGEADTSVEADASTEPSVADDKRDNTPKKSSAIGKIRM